MPGLHMHMTTSAHKFRTHELLLLLLLLLLLHMRVCAHKCTYSCTQPRETNNPNQPIKCGNCYWDSWHFHIVCMEMLNSQRQAFLGEGRSPHTLYGTNTIFILWFMHSCITFHRFSVNIERRTRWANQCVCGGWGRTAVTADTIRHFSCSALITIVWSAGEMR